MAELAQGPVRPREAGTIPTMANTLSPQSKAFQELLVTYSKVPLEEVEAHIFAMRDKAYKVFPYPCVAGLTFTWIAITRHPAYGRVLELLRDPGAARTFLDMGCCFAQDLRQVAADGVPSERLYGGDLYLEFLELGYELFRDRESNRATFVEGDILAAPGSEAEKDLKVLDGKIDIVHASNFLHLFTWEDQITAGKRLVRFLRPDADEKIIFGFQLGSIQPGNEEKKSGGHSFRQSDETFKQMWDIIAQQMGIRVETTAALHELPQFGDSGRARSVSMRVLAWEVKILES